MGRGEGTDGDSWDLHDIGRGLKGEQHQRGHSRSSTVGVNGTRNVRLRLSRPTTINVVVCGSLGVFGYHETIHDEVNGGVVGAALTLGWPVPCGTRWLPHMPTGGSA